jgi:hypothetical protein
VLLQTDQKSRPIPTMELCFLLSAPGWNTLEENGQSKARNIAKHTGVGMYIPKRPIQTLQKMVSLTGTSKNLIKATYHICGIHLESLKDGGRCFQGVVPIEDNSIPTLKDFPYAANTCERTLQWSRDIVQAPQYTGVNLLIPGNPVGGPRIRS